MKVLILPEVREYFKELIFLLYEKGYFSYEDNAINYVQSLFEDIRDTFPLRHRKPAPEYFARYGEKMFYSVFKKNKQTEWYVFFNTYEDKGEITYVVRLVTNNHVSAQYL